MPRLAESALSLLALSFLACTSSQGPPERAPVDVRAEEARQAEALAQAKAQAREQAVHDVYTRWQEKFVRYSRQVSDAARQAATAEPASPVRSVDELLAGTDPMAADPALRSAYAQWLADSRRFTDELRALGNDPETDVRSPLLPELREALLEEHDLVVPKGSAERD